MGRKRLDSVNDCFRHRVKIILTCRRCGRSRFVSPYFDPIFQHPKMRENMPIGALPGRLKCGNCGARGPRMVLE